MSNINIVDAIKMAAGVYKNDTVSIYTGQVVDISLADSDGIISVNDITSQVTNEIEYDSSTTINQKTSTTIKEISDTTYDKTIRHNVRLQSMPGDFGYIVPSLGSYVTVLYSRYQDAIVIGYQDVDLCNYTVGKSTVRLISDNILLDYEEKSQIYIGEFVRLIAKDNAEIVITDKVSIKNTQTDVSLYNVLSDCMSLLSVAASPPSGGPLISSATIILSDGTIVASSSPIATYVDMVKTKLGQILQ